MKNFCRLYAGSTPAALLLFFAPFQLPAQTPPANPEVQALRAEVSELKRRLMEVEARLAALPTPEGFPPGPDNYSLKLWDPTSTFDVLPTDFGAFRFEFISRHSNVPYFAGRGGTTSPDGWQGTPGTFVPDVARHENRLTFAINWRM